MRERIIACTTGISIAQGVRFSQATGVAEYRRQIRQRLDALRATCSTDEFLTRASAEVHSLYRVGAGESDEVYLLHSETEDGEACAAEVAALLDQYFRCAVELRKIEGLQVHNAQRFRRVGVQNLFATLSQICGPWQHSSQVRVILNATGGFKSAVPYVTLYGILNQLDVAYIFERSDSLITLPPAPVHFDYERLARAANAIQELKRQGVMPREKFFRLIPDLSYEEREWYDSLLEEENGLVTLSAFGLLVTEALETEKGTVYLSPRARRVYEESSGVVREQFNFLLSRIADPLWRRAKRHRFTHTDLEVYKPGRTAQRVAGFVRGRDVYVCELFASHDEYERELRGKRIADYDIGQFTPWWLSPDEPEPPSTEEELVSKMECRIEKLSRENAELESLWQEATAELARERARVEELEHQVSEAQRELQSLQGQLAQLREKKHRIAAALEAARRPWWRRILRLR